MGVDGIPIIVLKKLPTNMIREYVTIFNNALNNAYFLSKWKLARVKALKKGENPVLLNSYRPISLLPNIGKLFEKVINKSILKTCKEKDVLPNTQSGFRYKHSTIHAISKLTSDICWSLNRKKFVGTCQIDFKKAFDSVWLDGLFYKLLKKCFPPYLTKMFWNMLHKRKITVFNKNECSKLTFELLAGLQQGLYYSIFTHTKS